MEPLLEVRSETKSSLESLYIMLNYTVDQTGSKGSNWTVAILK